LNTFAEKLAAVLAGRGPLDALDDGRDRTSIVLEFSASWDAPDPFPGMVAVFGAKPADRVDESGRNKTE
jgi:hypothetical protein